MLSNQFSRLRHKRLTRRYRMTSRRVIIVFFCFCPFKLDADPVQKVFTAARLPANTCPSLYLRLSASQVHSAFFLRETVGGNNRAFMSHRETFVADLRRHFFSMTLLFREQQSRWTLSYLCQQGTCPHMSEMTTACTSLSDRITLPNMQLLSKYCSFTIYRLCLRQLQGPLGSYSLKPKPKN